MARPKKPRQEIDSRANFSNSIKSVEANMGLLDEKRDAAHIQNLKATSNFLKTRLAAPEPLSRRLLDKSGKAQLVKLKAGKYIRGRKITPMYPSSKHGAAGMHEIELFMLSNPGKYVGYKDIVRGTGKSPKTFMTQIERLRKRHNLPARSGGSILPINIQNAFQYIYETLQPKETLSILRIIYAGYKIGGTVIHPKTAYQFFSELDKNSKRPFKLKFSSKGLTRLRLEDRIPGYMKTLEDLEKKGKLPWKTVRFSWQPGPVGIEI